jgi:hypothetical protein
MSCEEGSAGTANEHDENEQRKHCNNSKIKSMLLLRARIPLVQLQLRSDLLATIALLLRLLLPLPRSCLCSPYWTKR